jgi:hypothetical protein
LVEKVSASDAQVSNTTGDWLDVDAGAVNSVNSLQMKASEFSVVPFTAPALAGVATRGLCAEAAPDQTKTIRTVIKAESNLIMTFGPGSRSNGY